MMQNRLDFVNSLDKFVKSSKVQLQNVLDSLGWKNDMSLASIKSENMVVCPYDNGHRILPTSYEQHVEECSLRKNGYSNNDLIFPTGYDKGPHIIKTDERTLMKILGGNTAHSSATSENLNKVKPRQIPQTSDRLISDFSPEERLAIYNHAVQATKKECKTETVAGVLSSLPKTSQQKTEITLEELLEAERNAKRRRIRYKSKKVHTNRKSQTEILREVIQSEMECYMEWLRNESGSTGRSFKDVTMKSTETDVGKVEKSSDRGDGKLDLTGIESYWEHSGWNYYMKNPHRKYAFVLKEEREKVAGRVRERKQFRSRDRDWKRKDSSWSSSEDSRRRDRLDAPEERWYKSEKHYNERSGSRDKSETRYVQRSGSKDRYDSKVLRRSRSKEKECFCSARRKKDCTCHEHDRSRKNSPSEKYCYYIKQEKIDRDYGESNSKHRPEDWKEKSSKRHHSKHKKHKKCKKHKKIKLKEEEHKKCRRKHISSESSSDEIST